MEIEFGVFDHLDRGKLPLPDLYESRLRLVEAYEAAGFHAYHLAEHHATPLGMAPCPGIFLSAIAQRTRRIRFGPMVYCLALYDPLRLIEEICMLDNLSGGRFDLGVGRGISPFELAYFGVNHLQASSMYHEALEVVLAGLTGEVLNHQGRHFEYLDVPMELRPLQQPHPPLWYGVNSPEAAVWPARNGVNVTMLPPAAGARRIVDRYKDEFLSANPGGAATMPRIGLGRLIYIAETDGEAEDVARAAYGDFYASASKLYHRYRTEPVVFPRDYDAVRRAGVAIAGSPDTVRREVAQQMTETGANYFVGRFAFGDLSHEQMERSIELFAAEIMPHCRTLDA